MPKFKTAKPQKQKKSNAGRKPLPTNLHVLNGNPSKINIEERKLAEPRYSAELPVCPEWLNEAARFEWDRLLPELDGAGLLKKVDMAVFAGYCDNLAMWQKANKLLEAEGFTAETARGGIRAHPAIAIRDKTLEKMKSFAVEFGFTPASRARVRAPEKVVDDDPMEALLKKRGG